MGETTDAANNLVVYIKAFLRKACSLGIPVVYVDQPQPDNLFKLPLASDIWRFYVKKHGGLVVDLFDLFQRVLSRCAEIRFRDIFRDDRGHLNAVASRWVARFINEFLINYLSINASTGFTSGDNFPGTYYAIDAHQIKHDSDSLSLMTRRSSLGSFDVLPIIKSVTYSIDVKVGCRVIGALWNYGQTSPVTGKKIRWVNSSTQECRSHKNSFLADKILNKPVLMFESFRSHVFKESGLISFSLEGEESEGFIEISGFLIGPDPDLSDDYVDLNIKVLNASSDFFNSYVNKNLSLLTNNLKSSADLNLDFMPLSPVPPLGNEVVKVVDRVLLIRKIGEHYESEGGLDIALKFYELALLIKPDAYWIRYKAAQIYLKIGDNLMAKRMVSDLRNSPNFSGKDRFILKVENL